MKWEGTNPAVKISLFAGPTKGTQAVQNAHHNNNNSIFIIILHKI